MTKNAKAAEPKVLANRDLERIIAAGYFIRYPAGYGRPVTGG